jgi:uncharacterized membrane protein (DUF373 family)
MTDQRATLKPTRRPRSLGLQRAVKSAVDASENGLYLIVGVLLLAAALLVITAATSDVMQGLQRNEDLIEVGFRLLREILLLLIVAELLHSLRFVLYQGEIPAEPFLIIGLIATVRRVVVVTAQAEGLPTEGRALTNFLLELGLLSVLAVAFAVAIYLLRRSEAMRLDQSQQANQAAGGEPQPVGQAQRGDKHRRDDQPT